MSCREFFEPEFGTMSMIWCLSNGSAPFLNPAVCKSLSIERLSDLVFVEHSHTHDNFFTLTKGVAKETLWNG